MGKQIFYHNMKEMSMKNGTWYASANEQERKEFREWLAGLLKNEKVTISFTKVNGDLRDMTCTLKELLIPADQLKKTQVKESTVDKEPTNQPVYDVNAQGWRSFRYDSITQISFTLGE
jgi:hypothetical protein